MSISHQYKTSYKTNKALHVAVAAINIMNNITPLALTYTTLANDVVHKLDINPSEKKSAVYDVIANGGHILDNLFFTKAEAYTQSVTNTTVTGEVLVNGDVQSVFSAGVANETTVDYGAIQHISNGGTVNDTTLYGTQHISNGGTVNDTTLYGTQHISNGGTANNTTISRGTQHISNGGIANNTIINSSGYQYISNGGTTNNTIINSSGYQYISNGGTANNTTINFDGYQYISNGGIVNDTIINRGGSQHISNGGIANNTTIEFAWQYVYAGGTANNTMLNNGALQSVYTNATANNTIISSGGSQEVALGGTATDITLLIGGAIIAHADGSDLTTIVTGNNVNGSFYISNGIGENFILYSDGLHAAVSGGISNNTIVSSGGTHAAAANGIGNNTIVSSGGIDWILIAGTANNTIVHTGGLQSVTMNGITNHTIIHSGGLQIVDNAGAANNTIISGGLQSVTANGVANNTGIHDGGLQIVNNTGRANSATISSGGLQSVAANGVANHTGINDGGLQNIGSRGVANSTIISSGGLQTVQRGGSSVDTTINTGGSMYLTNGAVVGGTLTNSGTVDAAAFNGNINTLAGSGGTLILSNINTASYNKTINIGNLSGSQTFGLSVDLKNNAADKIVVNNASGTHYIKVTKDASSILGLTGAATVVEVLGVDSSSFLGLKSSLDGITINPQIERNGNLWQIVGFQATASELSQLSSATADLNYAALFVSDSNLKRRLGDLRDNLNNSGIWLKTYGGQAGIDNNNLTYTTIQGGYDKVNKLQSGHTITGVTVEYLTGSTGYGTLGSGKLSNTRIGLYHTWLGNSGHYYDLVVKTGRIANNFTAYSDDEKSQANYKMWNTAVSAEYGYQKQLKYGYYITPQAGLSVSRINGSTYTTDKNTLIKQDAINSVLGRVGITVGRKLDKASYYLSSSIMHEFAARSKTTTGTGLLSSTLEKDLHATYFEFAVGGSVHVGNGGLIYLEALKNFGGKVNHKWQLQAGYRFGF